MNLQKTLEELVSIPSISSNKKACKQAMEYVKDIAENKGLKTKIYEKNEVYTLLIGKEIKNEYEVILNGHLDVVPAPNKSFKPKIKEEKSKTLMYGRGTSDMKGGDIAILIAFLESLDEGLDKDIALLFSTDEEVGGFDGIGYVVEQGLKANIVFIPDGGNNWSVCTDEKGVFHIEFKAEGKSAHGSKIWMGDNALLKLIKVYENMKKEFDNKWGKPTEKDNWKPTINLGALNGGKAANKVPNEATMLIDIRYPTPVTQDDLEKIVKGSLVKGVTWKAISTGAPLSIDMDNEYLKNWMQIIDKKELEKAHGASDGRFFAQKGIDVIITKPNSSEPHIDNEWIDLDDLVLFKNKIKEWLKDI